MSEWDLGYGLLGPDLAIQSFILDSNGLGLDLSGQHSSSFDLTGGL